MDRRDALAVARRQGKRLGVWLVVVGLLFVTVFVVYFATPFEGTGVDAVDDDPAVVVSQTDDGYVLEPADTDPTAGVVFYPGGRVDPNAYVSSLAPLVREANVTVVIPEMPLNLAIFDYLGARVSPKPDAATAAMNRHPTIDRWYVGGHSLGGAMACRYASEHTRKVDGLLLYAAYCDVDISDSGLSVVSVVGAGDTVLNRESYQDGLALLPADASTHELAALNHSQFGSYTGQPGDEPSPISYELAHDRLNDVVVPWLENETAR
jgi:pimeloyl-ACP methyl ester carboxylesterase